jgi:hypothetical protein
MTCIRILRGQTRTSLTPIVAHVSCHTQPFVTHTAVCHTQPFVTHSRLSHTAVCHTHSRFPPNTSLGCVLSTGRRTAEQEELERSLLGSAEVGELERQGEEEEENTISH